MIRPSGSKSYYIEHQYESLSMKYSPLPLSLKHLVVRSQDTIVVDFSIVMDQQCRW